MSDLPTLDQSYFDPATGRLLTLRERQERDRKAEQRADGITKLVARQAEKPVDHRSNLIASNEQRIAELQVVLHSVALPSEKSAAQRRIAMLETANAELRSQQATEVRAAKFASHPSMRLALEHNESFQRTPPKGADVAQVQSCAAILSAGFDDPAECAAAYWQAVREVEDAAVQRASSDYQDKALEVLRAEADAARAKVDAVDAERRAAIAREMSGGDAE